jgi:hypothetical protein
MLKAILAHSPYGAGTGAELDSRQSSMTMTRQAPVRSRLVASKSHLPKLKDIIEQDLNDMKAVIPSR